MGGSVTTTLQLAESLVTRGVEVHIVAPVLTSDLGKAKNLKIDARVKLHWATSPLAGSYETFPGKFLFLLAMTAKIRKLSPHIDVFHTQDFNVGLIAALIGARKPVAAAFGADPLFELLNYGRAAGVSHEIFSKSKAVRSVQAVIGALLSFAAGNKLTIAGLNEHSARTIQRYYSGPVVSVPVGINLALYRPNATPREDILLFAGRFVCWKGLDLAVDVLRKVRRHNGNVKLVCLGDGPLKKRYAEKYGRDGVAFISGADYKGVIEYYRKARLLLATSQYETFGITISEAMAAGLPIVAFDLEVYHDRLTNDENCYLVKNAETNVFAGKVMELLNDAGKREGFAAKALDTIRDYDLDRITEKNMELYRSLCAAP
ncbi:MAG: hypothetical protein A2285_01785 [Elusimicrobia bacterium RIFOXYA12_FULL_57_11]|nr:MAG: hypothetical protein A2285_01785 [Elusimicrobia bacterium RIFOXYA12_FULL_57_11]